MTEPCTNAYKVCRKNAGFTQEHASELLGIAPRTLSNYENGHEKVPDDIVKAMAKVYKCPSIAWWHLKNFSVLGEFLPEIVMPKTNGDMAFQLILANDDLNMVVGEIKKIMSDGEIGDDETEDFDKSIELVKLINAKLLSVIIHAGKTPPMSGVA